MIIELFKSPRPQNPERMTHYDARAYHLMSCKQRRTSHHLITFITEPQNLNHLITLFPTNRRRTNYSGNLLTLVTGSENLSFTLLSYLPQQIKKEPLIFIKLFT